MFRLFREVSYLTAYIARAAWGNGDFKSSLIILLWHLLRIYGIGQGLAIFITYTRNNIKILANLPDELVDREYADSRRK